MSFDVHGHAQLQPAQPRPAQAGSAQALFTTVAARPRSARIWLCIAMAGIGASLSTVLAGFVTDIYGSSIAFVGLAAVAMLGFAMIALLMPETRDGC